MKKQLLPLKHQYKQLLPNGGTLKTLIILMASMLIASIAFASGSGNGIEGSPHDFSDIANNSWNNRQEICRTCHVPHDHQRASYPEGLLWNHEMTTQTYTTYTFMDGTSTNQPDGISKLCLSCHDGTVAIDEWDGNYDQTGEVGTVFISDYDAGFQVPGTNNSGSLARTHPLSVTYNYDPADNDGLNDPSSTPLGTSGMINDVLENNKVQCSSCHDVHDNEAVGSTHLLRVSQKATQGQASGLCLACHNK